MKKPKPVLIIEEKEYDNVHANLKGIVTTGEPLLSLFIKKLDRIDPNSLRTIRGFRGVLNAAKKRVES